MKRTTNYRKQNEGLGEPLPKRSKAAKFGAPTATCPRIYEERRYGKTCAEWPQRGKPQRERHFKPNKWTMKENAMPWTNQNMIWPNQGTGGLSYGPPLNIPSINNLQKMPCQMQMPPSGSPPFMPPGSMMCSSPQSLPQLADVGGFRVPPPNMPSIHPQMPWQMQMTPSGSPPFVPPGAVMRTSPPPSPQIQQTTELPPLNKININELFQNLVSSGILGPNGAIKPNNKDVMVLSSAAAPIVIQPIDLAKRETIRTRQTVPIDSLYSGMQCSNCSERFPPEKTIEYGQHLDWHFRQKRRVRDQSCKASSRGWYSSNAGRMQLVAGEDSEESEKNVFESTKATSNLKRLNSPTPPSCPALPNGVDNACEICQEKLEQFYHDETEEWHLRNAIRVDDKVYHPLCYEDDKVKFSQNPTLSVMDEERYKKTDGAAACYSPPSNWADWKALKLQQGQPSQC
ncbi:unnamed protein product [Ceratitis capitata]|uniref:(Mediterranean fruit fly) hypothetical protein n=1 Tax=Ceratitis capitata TaxID=7213 RepID=A0A811VEL1_CERCA|nr:unnamed protein product [Ceratitis capitata]